MHMYLWIKQNKYTTNLLYSSKENINVKKKLVQRIVRVRKHFELYFILQYFFKISKESKCFQKLYTKLL